MTDPIRPEDVPGHLLALATACCVTSERALRSALAEVLTQARADIAEWISQERAKGVLYGEEAP